MRNSLLLIILTALIISTGCLSESEKKEERVYELINKKLSLDLLCACIQTYNDRINIEPQVIDGYDTPVSFSGMVLGKEEKLGLVYPSLDGESIIVAFRGTITPRDWITDFEFWQTKEYRKNYVNAFGLKIENGFYNIYHTVRDKVFDILKDLDAHHDKRLYITGHSLGATTATLLTLELLYNNYYTKDQITMYNYASPRVGNPAFARTYNKYTVTSIRFANYEDLVPTLPARCTFGYPYRHVDEQFLICFKPVDPIGFIANRHYSDNYYAILEKLYDIEVECKPFMAPPELRICEPPLTYIENHKDLLKKYPELEKLFKKNK